MGKSLRQRLYRTIAAATVVMGFCAATNASAAPVTIDFSGNIIGFNIFSGTASETFTTTPPALWSVPAGGFAIGTPFSGSYTYDSALVDQDVTASVGQYSGLLASASISGQVGGFPFATTSDYVITVSNDVGGIDGFELRTGCCASVSFVTGSILTSGLKLELTGGAASTFVNDSLPTVAPPLQNFSGAQVIWTRIFTGTGFQDLVGNLTSLQLSSPAMNVPEPATITLFAFGLAGLGFMTRRRRRGAVPA